MIIIERCPFCGGEADLSYRDAKSSKKEGIVFVRCNLCGAQTRVFESDKPLFWENAACQYAASAWNRRASDGRRDHSRGEYSEPSEIEL